MRGAPGVRVVGFPAAALLAVGVVATCGPAVDPGARPAPDPPAAGAQTRAPVVLDDFDPVEGWVALPSDGVSLTLSEDAGDAGRSLRFDFDFHGGGGWAAARKAFDLVLPENYELSFWIRGDAPSNTLELKLIDPTDENVWWVNRRDFVFPREWERFAIRTRHVEFAWGPAGGGEIRRLAALELAITAGSGGRGTVWIEDLRLTPLEPVRPYDLTPVVSASSSQGGSAPAAAMDGDPKTAWRSDGDGEQWWSVDFLRARELGGLVVDWARDHALDYRVEASDDGLAWRVLREVVSGDGGRDHLYLPETETRHLRLVLSRSARGSGYVMREARVQPLEWAESRNRFFEAVAADAPRGDYPRYLVGELPYWTVVGVAGDSAAALLGEDGAVEPFAHGFSMEPFLHSDGELISWADVEREVGLAGGWMPVPHVRWRRDDLALETMTFAAGAPRRSTLYVRYRITNGSTATIRPTLFVAIRPFQVNPSSQFLNAPGGAAPVRSLAMVDGALMVDGRRIVPVSPAGGFGAATFDQGGVGTRMRAGRLPAAMGVDDPFEAASGALAYPLELAAHSSTDIWLAVPLHDGAPVAASSVPALESLLATVEGDWAERLGRVVIELPGDAAELAATLRTVQAHVMLNQRGPAIQPGPRAYARSWIRDGALTSAALLRLGHHDTVRGFIEWYAGFLYPDGKVPCCVDRRGADPVPEHDSGGQFIYLVMEHYRHTGDRALLAAMWPAVRSAAEYLDGLRQERRTAEYRTEGNRVFFGLLPESISHEGYAAKPMHSYWDDFFGIRGFADAAAAAAELGLDEDARRWAAVRDEFLADVIASIALAMTRHDIDYLPGAAELGDFDATSTTIAVTPVDVAGHLPAAALAATFDRYWREFIDRRDGRSDWDAYTPYELRVVGTFVRLGQPERAREALDYFMANRWPTGWNQWPEVVLREPRLLRFIGDMPHTWVGSDFLRSVLDMLAYERERDGALVIGAGVAPTWLEGDGVRVRGLSTHYGRLDLDMRRDGDVVRIRLGGDARPPGGVILRAPWGAPRWARVDGQRVEVVGGEVRLDRVPADVVFDDEA